jgi:hypothetical protein
MSHKCANITSGQSSLMLAVVAAVSMFASSASADKRPPVKVSKAAISILTKPAEAFPDLSDIASGNAAFAVTAEHIALLRKLRLGWETAETGAPMVDPQLPYGTPDALATIGEITGAKSDTDRARQHIETYFALSNMLRHGTLDPGDYPLLNLKRQDIHDIMSGYFDGKSPSNFEVLGLTSDGKFRLTAQHLKLIRTLMFQWPDEHQASERLDSGEWPAPTMDPKRPYGDMSWFQRDMAAVLNLEVATENGEEVLTDDQEKELQHLHWQMLGALQVFVESADFKPGTYK